MQRPLVAYVLASLLAAVLSAPAAMAADCRIVRVWTGWHDAADFERIAESFTGSEPGAGTTILRTQPDAREGCYFLLRLADLPASHAGIILRVEWFAPGDREARSHDFPARIDGTRAVFQLGLTGSDGIADGGHPVAWRISVRDAEGHELASRESFLWE